MRREAWRIVEKGIWLTWTGEVPRFERKNRSFTEEEFRVVKEEIRSLLKQGVLKEVQEREDQCVNSISIGEREGDKRAVIDLAKLNEYLEGRTFSQEALKEAREILREGDFMVKIDFKRAYHAIAVEQKFRKFLRIRWENKLYEFQAMPLGLATSPFFFNQLMQVVAKELRARGIRLIFYVDDWIILGSTKPEAMQHARVAIRLMHKLGMTFNLKKSAKEAKQEVEFLGVELDTIQNKIRIPTKKAKSTRRAASKMLEKEVISARDIKRLIGKMTWASCAWRNLKMLVTQLHWEWKRIWRVAGWDKEVTLTGNLIRILKAIARTSVQKSQLEVQLKRRVITTEIVTDAGPRGGAAIVRKGKRKWIFQWKWTKEERSKSTNWRELKVMERVMRRIWWVKAENVRWTTDSVVAGAYVKKTIGKEKGLAKMSWRIRKEELKRGVEVEVRVVKGEMIQEADKLSRIVDDQDYQLRQRSFTKIIQKMGTPDIDLFATRFSKKVPRFVSKEFDETAEDTEAMTMDWRNRGLLYAFPPVFLIPQVLEKIRRERVKAIMVVPESKGARWHPNLQRMTRDEIRLGKAVQKEEREKIEEVYFKAVLVDGSKWRDQ